MRRQGEIFRLSGNIYQLIREDNATEWLDIGTRVMLHAFLRYLHKGNPFSKEEIREAGLAIREIIHKKQILHPEKWCELSVRWIRKNPETRLSEGDIVFCEVSGELLLHKIIAINGDRIQIGNNKGKVNGWTAKERIFGKYIKTVDLQSGEEMSMVRQNENSLGMEAERVPESRDEAGGLRQE